MATVAITGASGFLGTALKASLGAAGHRVGPLPRAYDREQLVRESPDVVINLAGEPIGQMWTDQRRRRIRESRVDGTAKLVAAIVSLPKKPALLLSGSAVGIYGASRGDEMLDESATFGADFLAETARDWEKATEPASAAGIRVVMLRTGLVMGRNGGLLQKVLVPFQLGVGGRVGDGQQWMSWISLEDYTRAIEFLINASSVKGPVNIVAPDPVRNEEFTRSLASVLNRPAVVPVPAFALRLALGEMADITALASQRVVPKTLAGAGFEFRHPRLEDALRFELKR